MNGANIRLSRVSYPRGTWWVMLLLALVFLTFGIWAEACLPEAQTTQTTLSAAPHWLSHAVGRL